MPQDLQRTMVKRIGYLDRILKPSKGKIRRLLVTRRRRNRVKAEMLEIRRKMAQRRRKHPVKQMDPRSKVLKIENTSLRMHLPLLAKTITSEANPTRRNLQQLQETITRRIAIRTKSQRRPTRRKNRTSTRAKLRRRRTTSIMLCILLHQKS